MPYVKVSRDKRGYETYYLLEPGSGPPDRSRPRILFWFRTPPQVRVGREPFSEEVRQAIESQNPDLRFDWPLLMAAQPPSQEAERWRERRRLERAARRAAREERETDADSDAGDEAPIEPEQPRHSIEAAVEAEAGEEVMHAVGAEQPAAAQAVSGGPSSDGREASPSAGRRRRRRRRRRQQSVTPSEGAGSAPPSSEPPPSSDEV